MSGREAGVARWLAKADSDLLTIANNVAAERTPWDSVCYHPQQAAEKTLKAFLIHHSQPIRKTHDLVALLTEAAEFDGDLTNFVSDCRALTAYGLPARYPNDIYEPTEQDARRMIDALDRVRSAILVRLR